MRGPLGARLTQLQMAAALSRELGRRIPESSVNRWEKGAIGASAEVYRAYMNISGAARPSDIGGQDERLFPGRRVSQLETRLAELERRQGIAPSGEFDDAIKTADAMALTGVSRQAIHNWVRKGKVRSSRQGRLLVVSRSDVEALAAEKG